MKGQKQKNKQINRILFLKKMRNVDCRLLSVLNDEGAETEKETDTQDCI